MTNTLRHTVLFFAVLLCLGQLSTPLQAKEKETTGIQLLQKMLHSMDHIRTYQADVRLIKTLPDRVVTLNYRFMTDGQGQAAAEILGHRPKQVYVANKKGVFTVIGGRAQKQDSPFPFDSPSAFLKQLRIEDVSGNQKITIEAQSDTGVTLNLTPLHTELRRLDEEDPTPVTKVELSIEKPTFHLRQVRIFHKNAVVTKDVIRFDYGKVTNRILKKKGLLRDTYTDGQEYALIHTKSVADIPGEKPRIEIKESFYDNVILNAPIDSEFFDEEHY